MHIRIRPVCTHVVRNLNEHELDGIGAQYDPPVCSYAYFTAEG